MIEDEVRSLLNDVVSLYGTAPKTVRRVASSRLNALKRAGRITDFVVEAPYVDGETNRLVLPVTVRLAPWVGEVIVTVLP